MSSNGDKRDMRDKGDKEKTCLYIEPVVHINIKNNDVLLYNTLDGKKLVCHDNPAIKALLERMISPQNLYTVIEESAILKDEKLHAFLEICRNLHLIDWYSCSKEESSHKKPVLLPPILNFHRDRKKMALDPDRDPGLEILKYLHKLNIYINCYGDEGNHVPVTREGYKQFPFPYAAPKYSELKLDHIRRFLDQVEDLKLCAITVLGGNIFQYTELQNLLTYLNGLPLKKELGIFYKDISAENLEAIAVKRLKDISIKVFVEPQMEKNQLLECIALLKKFNMNSHYLFAIQSEADADDLDEVPDMPGHGQFSVKPFYNGSNYDFFQENVFIEEEDLSNPVIAKKEIYARSVMNPDNFGHITIASSGEVYSNINEKPLGTIEQGVKQLLLKELSEGTGWFKLRKDLEPCGSCVYQQICPPVSNYEYAISRHDLCRLHRETPG